MGPARPVLTGRAVGVALATLLAALSLTVLAPSPAFACSCAALTTTQSVEGSDAVFLGTATADGVRVEEVFKGMVPSRMPLDGSPEPCGSGLVTGVRYVVFASWHGGTQRYSTDRCAGTAEAIPALVAEVERVAGDGRPPYDVPGGLPDDTAPQGIRPPGGWSLAVAGAGSVLVAFAMTAVAGVRRANRPNG